MRSSARFTASILIVLALILMAAGSPLRPAAAQPPAGKPRPAARLEPVFADPKYQLTGVAVSAQGRVCTNYPVWSPVHRDCVVEIVAGQARPYPDEAMNRWKPGDDGTRKWVSVQAVYVDDQDKLWVVDPAAPGFGEVYQDSNKLVRIDLATNKIERSYFFPGVADKHSYLNDVRVDTARQVAYLTGGSRTSATSRSPTAWSSTSTATCTSAISSTARS